MRISTCRLLRKWCSRRLLCTLRKVREKLKHWCRKLAILATLRYYYNRRIRRWKVTLTQICFLSSRLLKLRTLWIALVDKIVWPPKLTSCKVYSDGASQMTNWDFLCVLLPTQDYELVFPQNLSKSVSSSTLRAKMREKMPKWDWKELSSTFLGTEF